MPQEKPNVWVKFRLIKEILINYSDICLPCRELQIYTVPSKQDDSSTNTHARPSFLSAVLRDSDALANSIYTRVRDSSEYKHEACIQLSLPPLSSLPPPMREAGVLGLSNVEPTR